MTIRVAAASVRLTTGLLCLSLLFLSGASPSLGHEGVQVASADRDEGASPSLRDRQLRRGLRLDGLIQRSRGRCAGLYEIRGTQGRWCTHGPDPAPRGVDVTVKRSLRDLRDAVPRRVRRVAGLGPDGVPCVGDGQDGYRIQAIYARPSGSPDRFDAVAPLIRRYVGIMDQAVRDSAAATGGERHLRWVTRPDCSLDIARVILSRQGIDYRWAQELEEKGFDEPRRKYHAWVDAGSWYCGVATFISDDRPGFSNRSEREGGYARTDTACWFGVGDPEGSAELHEIWHTLGAVQASVPHPSEAGHCTDEWDVMCYDDGIDTSLTLTYPCPEAHQALLDCNHDDYFHTQPAQGSYLRGHLNTADSVYLTGSLTEPPPTPGAVTAVADATSIRVAWRDVPGEEGYRIDCLAPGAGFSACKTGIRAGVTDALLTGLKPRTEHQVRVCARGAGGTACADPLAVRTAARPTVVDDRSAGFRKSGRGWYAMSSGFRRHSFWAYVRAGSARAKATWRASLKPGRYEVSVFIPRYNATTSAARYTIRVAGGTVTRKLVQWRHAGGWVSLGQHDLASTGFVKLTDKTGERQPWRIAFDAVRFAPLETSQLSRR